MSAAGTNDKLSGAAWCARFPSSALLDDLAEPFRDNVREFITALVDGDAKVHVAATFRPPERAYLMHWCCQIVGFRSAPGTMTQVMPADVPAMAGVDIDWAHDGDIRAARIAALQMRTAYGIVYPAALESQHTRRLAIDMNIEVPEGSVIKDKDGRDWQFKFDADGLNDSVIHIGASFGVIKLRSDSPHWSINGH